MWAVYLRSLSLTNFRNYANQQVEFSSPKTILVGENAQGKSNLLEAVEVLATLKSHRAGRDREFVRQGETAGNVVAVVDRLGTLHELAIDVRQQGRRSPAYDGGRLSPHWEGPTHAFGRRVIEAIVAAQ